MILRERLDALARLAADEIERRQRFEQSGLIRGERHQLLQVGDRFVDAVSLEARISACKQMGHQQLRLGLDHRVDVLQRRRRNR